MLLHMNEITTSHATLDSLRFWGSYLTGVMRPVHLVTSLPETAPALMKIAEAHLRQGGELRDLETEALAHTAGVVAKVRQLLHFRDRPGDAQNAWSRASLEACEELNEECARRKVTPHEGGPQDGVNGLRPERVLN